MSAPQPPASPDESPGGAGPQAGDTLTTDPRQDPGAGAGGRPAPFRALLAMLAHHRGALTVAVVLSLFGAVLGLAQPMVINEIIGRIGQGAVTGLVVLLIGLLLVSSALSAGQIYVMTRTAEAAVLSTRQQLVARMLRLPVRIYDAHRTGDLVTRLGSDTTLVRQAFTGGLVDAVGGAVTMVGAVVLMLLIDPLMLLIVLAVVAVTMIAVITASSLLQRYTTKAQEAVGALGAGMDRALVAVRTIRATGAQDQVEAGLGTDADRAYRQGVRIARVEALLYPASGLAMQASFLIVLGVGGARVAAGDIAVADLVSFVLYLFMVSMPLGTIFSAVTTIRQAMGALLRIQQVMEQDLEPTGGTPAAPAHDLTFEGVSFSYDGEKPVLEDVSFHVPAGKKTALVGPSGSGKSTTLALIERFYDIDAGRILLGAQDAAELDRASLRAVVGYVEQEAAVLAGTVRENLQLGAPEINDERCWWALERVNLRSRFEEADGLDTVLGDRGMSLSGGQRQRLALARMLLMDTPILMLDEPTSAVDSQNEQLILDAIDATAQGRTLVVVAHRLSTVTDADQIIVMNNGRVEATGTHTELLETSPLYRDLASRQLLG
ncbi:ABC transporter ATP-binding protein [Corynebacterium halotolerans]|uniref:ABC transporter ATP-binding protein n=1 Tax=Corynebacterium halotolerans YIM 70093 = DSM 44683 TaxID=1121362 RepID=M1NN36_9CORY|nr:ABC transporter ATP-binding protein [Corynebacterium halotolerans]AGF72783.1 ABC transporter ATP-binding protein [Corynebacterium halotolerans YIM 70093 = DSM 44683]